MALPKIKQPLYNLTIPSSGQKIIFRGFTVKEQKILLMAIETNDENQITLAINQIIKLCVQDELDVEQLPLFDIEFIFLHISSKSSGEVVDFMLKCEKCDTENDYSVNITELELDIPPKEKNTIQLDDNLGIVLKYPTVETSKQMKHGVHQFDQMLEVVLSCAEYIYDSESVYYIKDHSKEEFIDFIESLNDNQLDLINEWFESIPELNHKAKFICKKCGHENKYTISGLKSFL